MSEYAWPGDFWPHQLQGCQDIVSAIDAGQKRIVLTSPTGMGKTRMMLAEIEWASRERWRSALYTHRRLLLTQTSNVLTEHGIEHGLRAAGHEPALLRDVQLCMTQSEVSAVFKRGKRSLHPADLVLSDELHAQGGNSLPTIHQHHYGSGAVVLGVTATPLDLIGDWDVMIQAGTTRDGRACGALVPAYTYCPDEPDLRHIKKYRVGDDLTDKENKKAIMRPGVFGRVYDHWKRLNPKGKPTLLFGPDVAGSLYFAQEFHKKGVAAAHIDAKQIWYNGIFMDSDDETRRLILDRTESGEVKVLCNRFVLREGIDLPHISHCIFACVFGSLKSYLQAGGRPLRAHPTLSEVCVQDHGGNYRRHGSLNDSRAWELGMSGYKVTGIREEGMREKPELEPIICPKCGMARLSGPTCPKCGHSCRTRSKMVVQVNGKLKPVEGPSYRPRHVKMKHDTEATWGSMYYRARSKKWNATFQQAEALFYLENHYYPPHDLPLMPVDLADRFERVRDVPRERLR